MPHIDEGSVLPLLDGIRPAILPRADQDALSLASETPGGLQAYVERCAPWGDP
jgi:hypothetical protein